MSAESQDLRRWLAAGAHALKRARDRLDAINVFPVADADTGTNMYLTIQEGNRAVAKLPASASHREVVAAFARGALLGARGNSGVIVSQYLSAFLKSLDEAGGLDKANARALARSLEVAADSAYRAVGVPVEGTILSVARAAADAATRHATRKSTREDVVIAAVEGARGALAVTAQTLPAARAAGVVDAGAAGLLLQLEMLAEVIGGEAARSRLGPLEWELASSRRGVIAVPAEAQAQGGAYEVMFVATVDETRGALEAARALMSASLTELGDSVAVTGTHGLIQAHVHTDRVDDAVAVGIAHKSRQIMVSSLTLGHGLESRDHHAPGAGMVALTACPGLAAALADAGAVVVVIPDASLIKPKDVRRAVRDAAGRGVTVVAGSAQLRHAARAAVSKRSLSHVTVLDAVHEAHVVAAVAAGALATPGEPLAPVMADAVARCAVTVASAGTLATELDRVVTPRTDVVTLILGQGVDQAVERTARERVARVAPSADVVTHRGGQATPAIVIGVEVS